MKNADLENLKMLIKEHRKNMKLAADLKKRLENLNEFKWF